MPLGCFRHPGKARRGAPSQETWPRSARIQPSRKGWPMINRMRGALPVALLALAVAAPAASAAPVSVNLRVEGATQTIFDGQVTTDGPPSSRGLGRRPLTAETGVRIPVAVLPLCRIVERSKGQPRCNARCNVARQGALRLRAGARGSASWAVVEYAPAAGPTVVSQRHRHVEASCGLAEFRAQVAATPASAPIRVTPPKTRQTRSGLPPGDGPSAQVSASHSRLVGDVLDSQRSATRDGLGSAGTTRRASVRPEAALEPCLMVTREVERGDHLVRDRRTASHVSQPGLASSPRLIFTCPPWMPLTRRSAVPL
jgi:hypothetical protein